MILRPPMFLFLPIETLLLKLFTFVCQKIQIQSFKNAAKQLFSVFPYT